jgi:hypothetical protein
VWVSESLEKMAFSGQDSDAEQCKKRLERLENLGRWICESSYGIQTEKVIILETFLRTTF